MAGNIHKNHEAAFKAKVALEALKRDLYKIQRAIKFQHPTQEENQPLKLMTF